MMIYKRGFNLKISTFLLLMVFFIVSFASQLHAERRFAKKNTFDIPASSLFAQPTPVNTTDFTDFEEKYRGIVKLESLKMYTKAQKDYIQLNNLFFDAYPAIKDDKVLLTKLLPIIVSSVFRLSEATSRSNYSNMFQLVHQISSFKTVHNHIEKLLTIIMDLRKEDPEIFPKQIYSQLLYARGVNRISWANKLLEGIPWKNYVVFPPQDIIGMVEMAMDDFEELLNFEGLPIKFQSYPDSIASFLERFFSVDNVDFTDYSRVVLGRFLRFKTDSVMFNIYRLTHLTDDYKYLADQVSKQYYYNVFSVLKYYQSKSVQRILKKTQKAHTLDDILHPKNKMIFDVFLQLVDMVDVRKH